MSGFSPNYMQLTHVPLDTFPTQAQALRVPRPTHTPPSPLLIESNEMISDRLFLERCSKTTALCCSLPGKSGTGVTSIGFNVRPDRKTKQPHMLRYSNNTDLI